MAPIASIDVLNFNKEVCFAVERVKQNGELKAKNYNYLILLSLENLCDQSTVDEYKRLATLQPFTLLCFIGHDGHSLHIVCPFTVSDSNPMETALLNAFRKLHFIY